MRTLRRALAFDWLYGYPGFDAALKDGVAADLLDGAAKMLALQSLADPAQASYHNHTARELALAVFALTAVEGHPSVEARAAPLREQARRAFDNILETTELVNPEGAYHESMDYMRITWAPLALMAELRRTTTGEDPARRFGVFRNMGPTYLYKVLPDGSTARDDDNEFPHLKALDNVVLGYAVHRFKDPFAAWIQKESGWLPREWEIPVLEFLWSDPTVTPRDPASTTEAELPRSAPLPGSRPPRDAERLGQGRDLDRVRLRALLREARPPRHQPLRDLPQGLPGHRRRRRLHRHREPALPEPVPAHRSPTTRCWSTSRGSASSGARTSGRRPTTGASAWTRRASGTRCGASRTGERTRDLWDRGRIEAYDAAPGRYVYARGDGTRAYQPTKVERFVRELLWLPASNVLFVLDRVTSRDAVLQEGVAAARRLRAEGRGRVRRRPRPIGQGGTLHRDATLVTFEDGDGRLRVHALLPREREVVVRGGPGFEFWTPGDEYGGAWGSGQELAARSAGGRPAAHAIPISRRCG